VSYLKIAADAVFDWGTVIGFLTIAGAIVTLFTLITGLDSAFRWFAKRFLRRASPEALLSKRQKWKEELGEKLPARDEYGTRGEAIIRDVARMDVYPDVEHSFLHGSSSFKVEVKNVYDKGLEVFIAMGSRIVRGPGGKWIRDDRAAADKSTFVLPVGRIPGELIESIDWDFDRVECLPQIFCRFEGVRGSPFEDVVWYRRSEFEKGSHILVHDYHPKLPTVFDRLLSEIRSRLRELQFWGRKAHGFRAGKGK